MSDFVRWREAEGEIARLLATGESARDRPLLFESLSNYSRSLLWQARATAIRPIDEVELTRTFAWLQRPVFVCGHHRSGTTLLQELLDGHTQLVVIPTEITYFASFGRLVAAPAAAPELDVFAAECIARLIDPNGKQHFHLGQASDTHNPSFEFVRRLFDWHACLLRQAECPAQLAPLLALAAAYRDVALPRASPNCWVEKSPLNELHFRKLAALPGARFIQLVREPAATLRSQLQDLNGAAVSQIEPTEQAWRIARSLRLAQRNQADAPGRYIVTRYEDLTADPACEMRRLCEFLAITHQDSLLRPTVLGRPVRSNSAFEPSEAGAIRPARQTRVLTDDELRVAVAITAPAARRYGYGVSSPRDVRLTAFGWWRLMLLAPSLLKRRAERFLAWRVKPANAARTPQT
jgi:hypothetical protein